MAAESFPSVAAAGCTAATSGAAHPSAAISSFARGIRGLEEVLGSQSPAQGAATIILGAAMVAAF